MERLSFLDSLLLRNLCCEFESGRVEEGKKEEREARTSDRMLTSGFSFFSLWFSYITPSKRDTEPSERQFKHIVWIWERCGDLMGPGVESVVVLLNCESGRVERSSMLLLLTS